MVNSPESDPEALWQSYQRLGSLRGVSRETGISHMVIRRRLLEAGYRLRPRTPNPEAMNPLDKVYLRPAQIKAIERLAAQRHGITRHAMARELIDLALRQFDPLYAKADQVETGPGGSSTVPASAPLRQPESPGRGMRGGTADP